MIYKFRQPLTPDETLERFELVELRGGRALFRAIVDMAIQPMYVFPLADMVEA